MFLELKQSTNPETEADAEAVGGAAYWLVQAAFLYHPGPPSGGTSHGELGPSIAN